MSTVVRSLAAKVEVQTRDAERNLDRFRAKLRATDIELRGAARYQSASTSPLFSPASVVRQSAAAQSIRVGEAFAASQMMLAREAVGMETANRMRRYGGSGIPVTSKELSGLTMRGGGSMMDDIARGTPLAEIGAAGAAGQAGNALARFSSLSKFSALLRGAGPIAAGVLSVRHGIQSLADTMSHAEEVTSDNNSAWLNQSLVMMDAVSRFSYFKSAMDSLASSLVRLSDYGEKYRENVAGMTTALEQQASATTELKRTQRDLGSAAMAEHFVDRLGRAEVETLSEQAEKSERFKMMQGSASSARERLDLRMNELMFNLMAGAISQEAFNEAKRIAGDAYDEDSGTNAELRYQRSLMAAEFEDRQRAEQESLANAEIMRQKEMRAARQRGIEVDLSRTFIGSGAGSGKKQTVEDPKLLSAAQETNRLLRDVARNVGVARTS